MKKPAAVKGSTGAPAMPGAFGRPNSLGTVNGITQVSPTQYSVQGSGSKPYIVDLEATDDALSHPTEKCTCTNWAIQHNKQKSTAGYDGYRCKHIVAVLDLAGSDISPAEAATIQARTEAIMNAFKSDK